MTSSLFEVVGLGNAIVDVLCVVDDSLLVTQSLRKGSMQLVDEEYAEALYAQMGPATECSGGSAANTLAGMASLGSACAFIGKVRDDELGAIFTHDLRSVGVRFQTKPATQGPGTGRCLVMVTQDAQRTMTTYLGACSHVREEDIDPALISNADITYVEGYLWDDPATKQAIRKAISIAKQSTKKVSLTLSDRYCVERHREEFHAMVKESVNVLFSNEPEIMALTQTKTVEDAIAAMRNQCPLAVITRSEKGCIILQGDQTVEVPGVFVRNVVDTTGAGDLFAAGFLYGYVRGWELEQCGALGNRCGAEIIQHIGARSQFPLNKLLAA